MFDKIKGEVRMHLSIHNVVRSQEMSSSSRINKPDLLKSEVMSRLNRSLSTRASVCVRQSACQMFDRRLTPPHLQLSDIKTGRAASGNFHNFAKSMIQQVADFTWGLATGAEVRKQTGLKLLFLCLLSLLVCTDVCDTASSRKDWQRGHLWTVIRCRSSLWAAASQPAFVQNQLSFRRIWTPLTVVCEHNMTHRWS